MKDDASDRVAGSGTQTCRLGDLPFVFLSYDEPWADWNWRALKSIVPDARRVNGVKGLDACHKAAADAVGGDWVVTVDADTRLDPAVLNATFPKALLGDRFRLDWLSRNQVNGLWSGNGSLKLWPKRVIREMRTHEAAPPDSQSLDHDVASVAPGQTFRLTRPERAVFCDPARTAQHAFRSGFRETIYLYQLARNEAERRNLESWTTADVARILAIWCSLGRHATNGLWLLYGARLGLLTYATGQLPDARLINDYDWLNAYWAHQIAPQFGRPDRDGPWRWDWLEDDLRHLGARISAELAFDIAEFDRDQSRTLFNADMFSATLAASQYDAVGYITMMSSPDAPKDAAALFDVARCLNHPAAYHNTGLSLIRGQTTAHAKQDAAWYFRAALALGNPFSQRYLDRLGADGIAEDTSRPARRACDYPVLHPSEIETTSDDGYCFVIDDTVHATGQMESHVPDPILCKGDRVIGYSCVCALTHRVIPTGIRFGKLGSFKDDPARPAYVTLPICLGKRRAPESEPEARAFAETDYALGVLQNTLNGAGSCGKYAHAYVQRANALAGPQGTMDLTPQQSAGLKFMLPVTPPKDHWLSAADKLDGRLAAAFRRTAYAVWGN